MRKRPRHMDWVLVGLGGLAALLVAGLAFATLGQRAALVLKAVDPPIAVPASLDAYRGLGSWVDMFDPRAWSDPAAAVRDMASHGVRTLFIETGNSTSPAAAVFKPAQMQTFIREAHAHNMRIVAWYLPDLTSQTRDYARIAETIRFRTSDGQRFDSFALDIESSAVHSSSARNSRLAWLSEKIRTLVGRSYPLGAIIPSPVGISKKRGYWPAFPYTELAQTYDVFVPMSYYTYHGPGEAAAYTYTFSNVRIIRAQTGCATTPIHLIGGITETSSVSEVRGFIRAEQETHCLGASLYDWVGTTSGDWQLMKAVGQ